MFNNVLDFACQYQSNFKEGRVNTKSMRIFKFKKNVTACLIARICFR